MATFTEMLTEAKRKAQLAGRPLTKQETAGIAGGFADTASARLARAKSLEIEETRTEQAAELQAERIEAEKAMQAERLAETKRQHDAQLEQRRVEQQASMEAASRAEKAQERQTLITTTAAGAGIGAYAAAGATTGSITGPQGAAIGAAVGMIVGVVSGGSYLCTEAKNEVGLTVDDAKTLSRFKRYAKEYHNEPLKFYLRVGPELTDAILKAEKDNTPEFYKLLIVDMIRPVIIKTDSSHLEDAYVLYRNTVGKLIKKYTPHLLKEYCEVVSTDNKRFKEAA